MKKPDEKDLKEKQTLAPEKKNPPKGKPEDYLIYGQILNFKQEEIDQIISDIDKHIDKVKAKRKEDHLESEWEESRNLYNGIVGKRDFPWAHSANYHIHITAMAVDIGKTKSKDQMFVSPMMICRPLPTDNTPDIMDAVKAKEEYLDYQAKDVIDVEEGLDLVLQDAWNLGTGIVKVSYERRKENVEDYETYRPEDLAKFEEDFKDDKGKSVYKRNHALLMKGETIGVYVRTKDTITDAVQLHHVQLPDLYVLPDLPDITKHSIIPERIKYSWSELISKVSDGYYDKKPILALKEKYSKDYWLKDYYIIESRYMYKYGDVKKRRRIIISYLEDSKEKVRLISYPWRYRDPDYIFYYIKRKQGSIYGEGYAQRLKHSNKALNALWNQTVDSGSIRNAPVFQAPKGSFDPSIKKYGPAVIWWTKQNQPISVLHAGGNPVEMINLISKMERYMELHTGVSQYMSGKESPTDPRAPASKAYMLLKEANLRVNDSIKRLHKCNKRLFQMIDSLNFQFAQGDEIPYYKKEKGKYHRETLPKSILGVKVQFIPQLSDITINRELEIKENREFAKMMLGDPMVASNPVARWSVWRILLRDKGGAWELEQDAIIGRKEEATKRMQMLQYQMEQAQEKERQAKANKGGTGGGVSPENSLNAITARMT